MYPRLSDIFLDLFGFEFPIPIYSFGAMVAVAVLVAAWLTSKELNRMYAEGRIGAVRVKKEDGKGRKARGTRLASPGELVGPITVMAVIFGIAGAKVFHILENLDAFFADPAGMIFSSGGLTFYGGFIFAGIAIAWYLKKKDVSVGAFADAIAPNLMLAYGIGRIGCYLAGDGDWGICSALANKPAWIPAFLWSETFPRSILGANAMVIENCPPWADGVYPTMLYEFAMAAALFGILWAFRRHSFLNGWLFGLYLVFSGIERFLIEQIRVNVEMTIFGITMTQAMLISALTVIAGVILLTFLTRKRTDDPAVEAKIAAAKE